MIEKIFSLKNNRKHKIITVLGIKLSIKKPFPFLTCNFKKVFKSHKKVNFKNKRAAIFACFDAKGKISDSTIRYLKAIKQHVDYLIVVGDNPVYLSEVKKIRKIADIVIFKRHGMYDFGSYKIGYFELKKLGVLDKIDSLLFFNDSVFYVGKNLNDIFNKSYKNDFYGIIKTQEGLIRNKKYCQNLHLQSWFLMFSSEVFNSEWFSKFMCSVKKEKNKKDIIINYEMGLSKLLIERGYKPCSYYPYDDTYYYNPDKFYASPKDIVFIKKHFLK